MQCLRSAVAVCVDPLPWPDNQTQNPRQFVKWIAEPGLAWVGRLCLPPDEKRPNR